jgi:HEAT repeat protein
LLFLALLIPGRELASAASGPPLARASWIWADESNSVCEVRKVFTLNAAPTNALVFITADNGYELYVNGSLVGTDIGVGSDVWQSVERYDVTSRLVKGRNIIGIHGLDLGGVRAVIAAVRVEGIADRPLEFVTDGTWRVAKEGAGVDYSHPEFVEGAEWREARVVGPMGMAPWGRVAWSEAAERARSKSLAARLELAKPGGDFVWPGAVAFLGDDCSVYVPVRGDAWGVAFRIGDWSRAYTEFDLPCPSKIGRKLYTVTWKQGARTPEPRLLLDAGSGVIGSPSVSFDGRSLFVAMARAGEKFFHIYRIPTDGAAPQRLTDGPFHDIDPAELPDGRIVFTSTRVGTFEEYHQPPSRALFRMNADGSGIHPITSTLIFDNEPKVTADGRIAFIRTDNFFDRGKVETHLHTMRPDGTDGFAEIGANVGADYGVRLRAFGYGSPAPMPDGRLAFISNRGNFIAAPGGAERDFHRLPGQLGDLAPLPDGRLLCTVLRAGGRGMTSDVLGVIDPRDNRVVNIFESSRGAIHSPVFLGPRERPPVIPDYVDARPADQTGATGFLFCQDARFTTKTKADWKRIRAIRVLGAIPLTTRSSHSHIVHVGQETVELGTVPLAPDGSFFVEVPADMPLALQAVDAEGRSELNEMSWLYVRPGERRSCIGCHQPRDATPALDTHNAAALRSPALKLLGQGTPHRFRGNNPGVTGMMDLQFERFRECASLNRNSLRDQPLASGREEIAALLAHLAGPDDALRISAAQRLALFREHEAAAGLAHGLKSTHREVRVAAALAIAPCGTREAVPALLAALQDRDAVVAQAANVALENITGHTLPPGEWQAWFASNSWSAIERRLVAALDGSDRRVSSRQRPHRGPLPREREKGIAHSVGVPTLGNSGHARLDLTSARNVQAASEPINTAFGNSLAPGERAGMRAIVPGHLEPTIPNTRAAIVALGHIGRDAACTALRGFISEAAATSPYPPFVKDNRTDNFTFGADSHLNPRTLQEAVRALGQLRDTNAVSLLRELLARNIEPRTANLFLAEAIIESLGRIGTVECETALIDTFAALKDYWQYVGWYSDHPALYACHSSPVHARIIEALDRMGSTRCAVIVPQLIRSVPTDPDRALFPDNDNYEMLVGRLIRRSGRGAETIETCLALLGDPEGSLSAELGIAVSTTHPAWAGHPGPENRAAQTLSLICRDSASEPRVRSAFARYRALPEEPVQRALGNPTWTPVRHWVLFYLARTLGQLSDRASVDTLASVLSDDLNEARHGRPDPSTPEIHFLHLEYTPCWRAAAAWALGRIGDPRAVPHLLRAVRNLDNAPDVRHAAAVALGEIADPASFAEVRKLASDYPEVATRRALVALTQVKERSPRAESNFKKSNPLP